ncbi:hypothetical protein SGM_3078 [Streptomyces griseoaurantiacus M045]|uniref:Uncharacterized protein n=1 Tax=Streptomyces griseoaurantiacus M045 TaxID=996637 RepID=F3NJE4_9ACTN|nr:hypothetical protein SGM_3078 [Streptomyces griseoaurantiacus M045]
MRAGRWADSPQVSVGSPVPAARGGGPDSAEAARPGDVRRLRRAACPAR